LTPVRLDWLSAVPLVMTTVLLLASPPIASSLARGGFGTHLLDRASIETIEGESFLHDLSTRRPGKSRDL